MHACLHVSCVYVHVYASFCACVSVARCFASKFYFSYIYDFVCVCVYIMFDEGVDLGYVFLSHGTLTSPPGMSY